MEKSKDTSLAIRESEDCFFYKVEHMGIFETEPGGEVRATPQDDGTVCFEVLSTAPGSDTLHFTMPLEEMVKIATRARYNAVDNNYAAGFPPLLDKEALND